ncbi:enoyl-CoA hydratase/isomerase family protein [Chloroflexota bacterium]
MMDYETLKFECHDHIGLLTLDRPQCLNAFSMKMVEELRHFFGSLEDQLAIRVVIIRGAGQAFCTGMDLKEAAELRGDTPAQEAGPSGLITGGYNSASTFGDIVLRMRRAPQPLIAAIRGPAVGGGFSFAMACDLRIASQSALFQANYVRVGISGGDMGSSYLLPRLLGMSWAAEYIYTARPIDAATAERIGLVCRVVPDDELEKASLELAGDVLKGSPFALRMTKEVLNANIDAPSLMAAIQMEDRTQLLCGLTEDAAEGAKAFVEKRLPQYHDR